MTAALNESGADAALVLSPEMQQALAGLRELQWVEWVDVAAGRGAIDGRWLIAGGGIFLALVLVLALLFFLWRRQPRQRALTVLRRLRHDFSRSGDASRYVTRLAALFRHAISDRPGKTDCPPGTTGQAWLAWLDQAAPPEDRGAFTNGPGRVLALLPFARSAASLTAPVDVDALHALSERWLRANR